jgi:uncharacterized RDD family membrane protein YckC
VIDPGAIEQPPLGLQPAGLLRRIPATIVDMIVFCGICFLLAYPVCRDLDWQLATADPSRFLDSLTDPGWIAHAAGILGLWIALWWCYFAVGWGLLGATVGKWIFGLRIVDHRGRSPIGLSRAFLRLAAYSVSSVTLGMGHLLIELRPDRRALHDVLAGTWVVRHRTRVDRTAVPNDEAAEAESDGVDDEL